MNNNVINSISKEFVYHLKLDSWISCWATLSWISGSTCQTNKPDAKPTIEPPTAEGQIEAEVRDETEVHCVGNMPFPLSKPDILLSLILKGGPV